MVLEAELDLTTQTKVRPMHIPVLKKEVFEVIFRDRLAAPSASLGLRLSTKKV